MRYKIIIFLLLFFAWNCKKSNLKEVPLLKTLPATVLNSSSVKTGGEITSEGSGSVSVRGVCWSPSANKTIQDTVGITTDGNGIGQFSSTIGGLKPGTTYFIKAYATNNAGTGYGNELTVLMAPVVPTVTTGNITVVSDTVAVSGGEVLSDGGAPVTERGICWNTVKNPTRSPSSIDPFTKDSMGIGKFFSTISLSRKDYNATFYLRAYATNSVGTAYGIEFSFSPAKLLVKDKEGNFYHFVKIGTQIWMVENLKTTLFNDSSAIDYVEDSTPWNSRITAGYCWYDNDETTYKNTFGALYNWYAVGSGNLCPTGWHVPSDSEWSTLSNYLGGVTLSGGKLKETGVLHWKIPNAGATNETGFAALPGGYRTNTGLFENIGNYGHWWSSTPGISNVSFYRYLYYGNSSITSSFVNQKYGLSVKCLKN
jgi:uncharacterized protein (TIGR02145 family)